MKINRRKMGSVDPSPLAPFPSALRFCLSAVMSFWFFSAAAQPPAGARAIPVEVQVVERRPVAYKLSATGSLEADEMRIACEVPGVVREVLFEEGDAVEPGQVLATVDPERHALVSARAKAAYERAAAQAREAESALARRRKLRDKDIGWLSEEEILQYEARLAEAQAAAREAEAAWELARQDEARSRIRSPFAGTIERRFLVAGQHVQAGAPAATVIERERMRLRFRLAEAESGRMAAGQKVSFRTRAHPESVFHGTVFHIAAQADPATRSVECVARVEDPEGLLRAGQFAEIQIELASREDALAVPETALLPTDKGYVVFVADGTAARARPVTLGLHLVDGTVEIVAGLAPGDRIVTRGAKFLKDGMSIQYKEP